MWKLITRIDKLCMMVVMSERASSIIARVWHRHGHAIKAKAKDAIQRKARRNR